jgi:hypothetical protein
MADGTPGSATGEPATGILLGGHRVELRLQLVPYRRDGILRRTGPVLEVTPGAWRRFADQVKRSLARGRPGAYRGTLTLRMAPLE